MGVFFPPCGVKVISYGASIDRGFLCLCSFWLVTRHWLTNQIVKQLHYHGSNISRYTRLKNTCFFEYIDFYPKTNVDPPIWTDTNTQRSTHILDSHPVSRTPGKKPFIVTFTASSSRGTKGMDKLTPIIGRFSPFSSLATTSAWVQCTYLHGGIENKDFHGTL